MNFHNRERTLIGDAMLRFLTENGRSRSNSRQLSEILFLVKLKYYKERKTTF
jgi:hypothetical protein